MIICDKDIKSLDEFAAFDKIIRKPEDMPRKLKTIPMDDDWKEAIKDKFWATNYQGVIAPMQWPILKLRDHLLKFGGEEVCLPAYEQDLDKILTRGQFWYGDRYEFIEGEPNGCHRNSSHLWLDNKDSLLLATGYALSYDGMWRQHTWLIHPRTNYIIETTAERLAYFGFVLNLEEAEEFSVFNI